MKTFAMRPAARREGFTLILVLACLILLVGLVVGILSWSMTERAAASGFHAEGSARQLADTAVSLVEAQVNLATTQATVTTPIAWASQPGMIRTYDATGNLKLAYKLYSSPNMVIGPPVAGKSTIVDSSGNFPDAPPAAWSNSPAVWTDLNQPVQTGSTVNYPILDPTSLTDTTSPAGFSITSAPGATTYQTAPMPVQWLYQLNDGTLIAPDSGSTTIATFANATKQPSPTNPIVGRIAFWADDDTCKVNVNTSSQGTYWSTPYADSVSTGATDSNFPYYEQDLAYNQPVQHEWQRYPGHPAMTSLSTVFPWLSSEQIYSLVPRVVGGGSMEGTLNILTTTATTGTGGLVADADRLYANIDELLFSPSRAGNPPATSYATASPLTKTQVEQAKFFLTARSRAPEINLFNLPRIACWPIYNGLAASHVSVFDQMIALCSSTTASDGTLKPYYFQRQNSVSPTTDISITRNQQLYSYLQYLTGQSVPGYPSGNFLTKYGNDRDQILTEIFDYIRCANLNDPTVTNPYTSSTGTTAPLGWVVPTQYTTPSGVNTMGFGRTYTMTELAIGFICNADGNGTNTDLVKTSPTGTGTPPTSPNNVPPTISTGTVTFGNKWPFSGGGLPSLDDWQKLSNTATNTIYQVAGTGTYVAAPANLVLGGTPLNPGQKYIQAIIVPKFFCPAEGWVPCYPNMSVQITGLSNLYVTISGTKYYPFPSSQNYDSAVVSLPTKFNWGLQWPGAGPGWRWFLGGMTSPALGNLPGDSGTASTTDYFIGVPMMVPATSGSTMSFHGSTLKVSLFAGAGTTTLIQTINVSFAPGTFPIPNLVTTVGPSSWGAYSPPTSTEMPPYGPQDFWSFSNVGEFPTSFNTGTYTPVTFAGYPTSTTSQPYPAYAGYPGRLFYSTDNINNGGEFFRQDTSPAANFDVIRSMVTASGDHRLIAGTQTVPAMASYGTPFAAAGLNGSSVYNSGTIFMADLLGSWDGMDQGATIGYDHGGSYISATLPPSTLYPTWLAPDIPSTATQTPQATTGQNGSAEATGDFDNGIGPLLDGPFINKPDEGNTEQSTGTLSPPYFISNWQWTTGGSLYFSPNRQMPSPGMFGSLSTGVQSGVPWQTLLFRPQPGHYGATTPEDELLLDLFWMPVVEPYAISDRFSSAGLINMNYQIMPFTYITRSTGMQAVLKSERLGAIPNSDLIPNPTGGNNNYKPQTHGSTPYPPNHCYRLAIDIPTTLSQFDTKFSSGDIFRSPSEICDQYVVPTGQTVAGMPAFWAAHLLTGDNLRERIYATIYPRITTKSNTYTVHFRAQALKKVPTTNAAQWVEGQDVVTGEYRGSTSIERFINPSAAIPDYAADAAAGTIANDALLDTFYKWHIIENRQFAP